MQFRVFLIFFVGMIIHYLRLVRWQNLLFLCILLWVLQAWVALPVMQGYADIPEAATLPWWLFALITSAVVCIAAGGYVINDYFDVKIDRINRPDRLIVTQSVEKLTAMRLFQVLTAVGVAIGLVSAWLCRSRAMTMVFLLTPGLLWFYSASYKRMLIIGNLIIAFCTTLVPLMIAMADIGYARVHTADSDIRISILAYLLYRWLGGFALFAFLTTWIREIIKDMQDQTGDRELECHTLPIVIGNTWTKVIVTGLIAVMTGLMVWLWWSVLPFDRSFSCLSTRYLLFGILVPLLCEVALLWSARIPSDYRTAQQLMKFIMFIGSLYSFCITRLLTA